MVWGKDVRLSRITKKGKMLCVPMDHGVTLGPIKGIARIESTVKAVSSGGATAVILHKGIIKSLKYAPGIGLVMHLSASTVLSNYPNWKVLVGSIEEGLRLGADAISIHVNLGNMHEHKMLRYLGLIAAHCDSWGIPLLAMMYPRGENIKDPLDPKYLSHVVRVGAELGADIVKTPYSGSPNTFKQVVEACPVPVVIAGGPKVENDVEVLRMVKGAMEAGAIGVTIGRNVFAHENPTLMVSAIGKIVFEEASVEKASEVLEQK
ncbi:MAG: fructose-bisphosphate aldolase [Thermoprotei archaeon]|nr:MAG: fructose-bisphosphate aldolase [Thermoprotei archaeon]